MVQQNSASEITQNNSQFSEYPEGFKPRWILAACTCGVDVIIDTQTVTADQLRSYKCNHGGK